MTIDGELMPVDALLDTGFTDWIAMNIQDIESLGWLFLRKHEMQTARGFARFNLYQGSAKFDGQVLTIPVLGGEEITEVLLGLAWLADRNLVVNRKKGILTLGDPES